ncbi:CYTH domain-containing protein [Methylovirgula sp. 4M-Z18]|uniref:CYTH domain-containing protein n=1 Tax=Methylovirgula sp. 4M-Z18 TaxID=2293567 RepID=UPI000E2F1784|nr:CYTH domain-containing protein [Methylovirgula sp. 4M-Z18]RFB80896.1 CYTH domain-containing protein [Methylovirgula sp. 4M-Z18]
MALEIERKFLVVAEGWRGYRGVDFRQNYLSTDPWRTVRVRIAGPKAFLTVKGKTEGLTKLEFEYEIPVDDAEQLMLLCQPAPIEKIRYRVPYEGFIWEVDVFHGINKGLIIAEIELDYETQPFAKPDWIGKEVTFDRRYSNSNLILNPYSRWSEFAPSIG